MKKALLTIAVLALLGMGAAQAQTHFSFRFGGNFPDGKFADATGDYANNNLNWGLVDNSKKGGAGIGIVAGLQMKYDISSVKGLGVIVSVDGMFNSLNSEVTDYFDDYIDDNETSTREISITLPKYFNLPLMAGLNYTYDVKENLGIFAEAAMGANIRVITDMENTITQANTERITTQAFNSATTFAYRLGAGIVLNDKYTLGIDYYNLGMAKADGVTYTEVNGTESNNTPKFKAGKIKPTNITLRFGINF